MRYFIQILVATFLSTSIARGIDPPGVETATMPNVIVIMTDDQGYGDLSCHGNPVLQTPNIDKLYEQSVRFTDFHVDPTCAPTRAALLTGKYSHHVRVWHTIAGGNHLRASEITMADIFKANGYRTGLFGKWHLGANYPFRPMDRGFDEWLGNGDGGTGTTDDWFDNDRVNDYYWHNGERVQREGYAPDVFFDAAIDFINTQNEAERPFFVYLANYLPHDPHTVPDPAMLSKYKEDVSDMLGANFAGIERIDHNVGRLRKVLDTMGISDETILIFMTDNGSAYSHGFYNAGMRGHKCDVYEGGHRVPFFIHWPKGQLKHGYDVSSLTAHIDVLPTLIELCELSTEQTEALTFDGRSFKQQLFAPETVLPARTLFVENQRTFTAQRWHATVGMTQRWRLINDQELYDITTDPAQQHNVIHDYPEVVRSIRLDHQDYWNKVSPGDRESARPIVGHARDPETFLTPSDWYLPDVPWHHAQIAEGSPLAGAWQITIAQPGVYRFEVRRWPREASATIQGIPDFSNKTVDAWNAWGGIDQLIYGSKMVALPVEKIRIEVGTHVTTKAVGANDQSLVFDIQLPAGDTQFTGTFLDKEDKIIAGTYYLYVKRVR